MFRSRSFWMGLGLGVVLTTAVFIFPMMIGKISGSKGQISTLSSDQKSSSTEVDIEEITRDLRSSLAISVDGGRYDASALANDTVKVMQVGFTKSDALSAVKILTESSLSPELMSRVSLTVGTIAKVSGKDLATTTQKISEGVTRGYDACAALDNELNFLTAGQRSQIRQDFEAGEAAKARIDCFSALEARALLAAKAST